MVFCRLPGGLYPPQHHFAPRKGLFWAVSNFSVGFVSYHQGLLNYLFLFPFFFLNKEYIQAKLLVWNKESLSIIVVIILMASILA